MKELFFLDSEARTEHARHRGISVGGLAGEKTASYGGDR